MAEIVLVINPGSTSWKLGVYDRSSALLNVTAPQTELQAENIVAILEKAFTGNSIRAIVSRGGLLKPLPGGVYQIDGKMVADLQSDKYGKHASNLGAPVAQELAHKFNIPAFIVDPVTSDEFIPEAVLSGVPGIERNCRGHMLNIRAAVRRVCEENELEFDGSRWVVAHLGGGISVAAIAAGKVLDINDALLGEGPFTPQRSGSLPLRGVLDLAYAKPRAEVEKLLVTGSGLQGYLGTDDLLEIEQRIAQGDEKTQTVFTAMLHQIAKEIGAMAAVLRYRLNGIILTGGMVRSERVVKGIKERIGTLGPVTVYPGEMEMEALARGAWRVLDGIETIKKYG